MTPEREHTLSQVLQRRQGNLTVVLENVSDPHNISAVMRTCDAVGVWEIFVLNTRIPRHRKWGSKSSSSADKWIQVRQYEHAEECFQAVRQGYDRILATCLSEGARDLYSQDLTLSTALVFGNEHSGVSPEVRALTDASVVIPQMGIIRSLNISVACAVCLYEALRQKTLAGHYRRPGLEPDAFQQTALQWGLSSRP